MKKQERLDTDKRQLDLSYREAVNQEEIERASGVRKHKRVTLTCDPKKGQARQEFKADCDVNTILKRHGAIPPGRPPQYGGTVDYDINLQQGLQAVERSRQAWARIPIVVRSVYKTWEAVQAALQAKKLEVKGGKLGFPDPPKPPVADPPKPGDTAGEGGKPPKKD